MALQAESLIGLQPDGWSVAADTYERPWI